MDGPRRLVGRGGVSGLLDCVLYKTCVLATRRLREPSPPFVRTRNGMARMHSLPTLAVHSCLFSLAPRL